MKRSCRYVEGSLRLYFSNEIPFIPVGNVAEIRAIMMAGRYTVFPPNMGIWM